MRVLSRIAPAAMLLAVASVPIQAQTVVSDPGTYYTTNALTGFATSGSDMLGMTVTGYGLDGTVYSGAWSSIGSDYGVQTDGFSLFHPSGGGNADTFGFFNLWSLSANTGLSRLVLDGIPGNTLFDRTNPSFGTSGSAQGRDFDWVSGDPGGTTVFYRNALGLGGGPAVGDLYTMVDVQFGDGFRADSRGLFRMDTDNAATDIVVSVPEPGTLLLLLAGMLPMVGGVAVRRRESAA